MPLEMSINILSYEATQLCIALLSVRVLTSINIHTVLKMALEESSLVHLLRNNFQVYRCRWHMTHIAVMKALNANETNINIVSHCLFTILIMLQSPERLFYLSLTTHNVRRTLKGSLHTKASNQESNRISKRTPVCMGDERECERDKNSHSRSSCSQ